MHSGLRRLVLAVACLIWIAAVQQAGAQLPPTCGDLDGNGVIDALDARILRAHESGLAPLSPAQAVLCDVIGEGRDPALAAQLGDPASQCSLVDAVVMARDGQGLRPGSAQICPGASRGDCCSAHATAGCGNAGLVACVCTIDPTCCTVDWDAGCALLACSGPCTAACTARPPAGADVPDGCFGAGCCPAGLLSISGTPGPDLLQGGAANECLIGFEDADQLDGGPGNDALLCGPGADGAPGEAGNDTLLGGGDIDTLAGGDGCDLIAGGQGDDTVRGGADADTLVPGRGRDVTFGNDGHDLIVIRSACEITALERVDGGNGTDTLRSPFTQAQLGQLGVVTTSVEHFAVVPPAFGAPAGACYPDTSGQLVCECCDHGFDPATLCQECPAGFHPVEDASEGEGDAPDPGEQVPVCLPDVTCDDLDCGAHGTCVEDGPEAHCDCDCGYAGALCNECTAPWEPDGLGGCYLGESCGQELCSGNGSCVADAGCELSCVCDDGWDDGPDCDGPRARIGGPDGSILDLASGAYQYAVGLRGATCNVDFEWSIVEGSGTLQVNPADSRRITLLNPHAAPGKALDSIVLRAECGNDPSLFAEHTQTILKIPTGTALEGNVGFVEGVGDALLEPFDQAMLDFMQAHDIPGGALALTYQEGLVFLRAYGIRQDQPIERPMRTCTPMRVASVTKPFTQAAIVNGLYGTAIPGNLGGGTAGANTAVVPILAGPMQLSGNQVDWQAPASLYSASYPQNQCSSNSGVLNPNWSGVTLGLLLQHLSGVWPNQSYLAGNSGACTGAAGENCRSFANVNDPMTTGSNLTGIANTLGLDHGVLTLDDILHWSAGLCLYDTPANQLYRYSNFGYAAAGRVLELVTGQGWESFMLQFLTANGVIGPTAPGNAFAYQGQNDGSGPAAGSVPEHLLETRYFSDVSDGNDVTTSADDDGTWIFPNDVKAPYGRLNMDVMYPHGSLVANVEALSNFMHEFRIDTGAFRDAARGGAGYNFYPNNSMGHGGLLWGTSAEIWEMPNSEPQNGKNPNGPGCLIPEAIDDPADPSQPPAIDQLEVEPCPLPPGIRIAVIFNKEQILPGSSEYVAGLHTTPLLLKHRLRRAAAQIGGAAEWGALRALDEQDERRVGCDLFCPPDAVFCVPITCGNGVLDPDEMCDDGNNVDGDGCEAECEPPDAGPDQPGGYDVCAAGDAAPGECLGGPCALIAGKNPTKPNPGQGELVDPHSAAHPDGNHHPDYFCEDNLSDADFAWTEATCVRELVKGDKFGVCLECGVDTMLGCLCPNPNGPDFGCGADLTCIGGRCYPETPGKKPDWMCSSWCADIYGSNSGYCLHDSGKDAVCYPFNCDEPSYPVPYCDFFHGSVCDPGVNGCANDSCCVPECLSNEDCSALGHIGHMCTLEERCRVSGP